MTTLAVQDNIDLLINAIATRIGEKQSSAVPGFPGLRFGMKHDATGTPIASGYSHGPGGLLTWPGVDQNVFSAMMGAESLLSQLPATPALDTNPTYMVLTGVQDDSGAEPDAPCDDPPVAGLMKACMLTSVFGRYERSTGEIEINRLGQRVDRGDPLDLRLINTPIAQSGMWGGPGGVGTPTDLFLNETSRKFWERNVAFHRLLSRQLWLGNPGNNTGAGGYKELTGIDLIIATGHVDAETGVACAAADSYVRSYGNARIDSNGGNLVAAITDVYYQLKDRALRSGAMPVRWVIAMRPQLFYEISGLWPCSYLSYRCNLTGTSATEFIDSQDAIRIRDAMRQGRYLLIDGEQVEVVLDDGIDEDDGNSSGGAFPAGCFRSSVYFLPMSVVGGRASLYMEYFQYNNPSIQTALGNMVLAEIEGAFITWPKQTNLCVSWASKIEPRLVLRTPWLAGRLDNVVYCPVQHTRDAFPEGAYFVDGGKTSRTGPSLFNLWS